VAGRLVPYPNWLKSNTTSHLGGPAVVFLCLFWFVSTLTAGPVAAATPVESQLVNLPESLYIEARDGFPLHVSRYRPVAQPTGVLILIHDWAMAGISCWGTLPDSLAAAGFEVLVPDLRGHGLSRTPLLPPVAALRPTTEEMAVLESDARYWLDLIGGATNQIGLLCVGALGSLAPRLVLGDARFNSLVWVSPDPVGAASWQRFQRGDMDFLFIASQTEIESSALAGDLFSRFNNSAQLRLFSRGAAGCELLNQTSVRYGLVRWIKDRN
jgi:pimeloyl-ACP methyl ester carboxylesterase